MPPEWLDIGSLAGQFVALFDAALRYAVKTCADFHAIYSVDAHHRVGDFDIEEVENGLAQADGDIGGFNMQLRADGIQRFAHTVHIVFQLGNLAMIGGKKRILGNVFAAFKPDFFFADLGNVGGDFRAEFFFQPFLATAPQQRGRRFHGRSSCRRRGSRACRICANRYSRHGLGGNFGRCCRSLCCAGRYCGLRGRWA